jgi:hypothetical protein
MKHQGPKAINFVKPEPRIGGYGAYQDVILAKLHPSAVNPNSQKLVGTTES